MAAKDGGSQDTKRRDKGKKLEREFAVWMQDEVGYTVRT